VLAALANAVLLVFACGFIADAAIGRLLHPAQPATGLMMGVAVVGILINGATAMMFLAGRREDVNVRAAFLHMAADAGISAGVAIAGGLILITGLNWIDPALSVLILLTVLAGAWDLLKEALNLAMDRAPAAVDVAAVRAFLETCPQVCEVHDLHIWPLSTTETALTAHLVRPGGADDAFLKATSAELDSRFNIRHATLQVEIEGLTACEALHA
jgi:cobalt-zinc-cadmium efflux system protein